MHMEGRALVDNDKNPNPAHGAKESEDIPAGARIYPRENNDQLASQIVEIDRNSYIRELQELRKEISTLHNHKEAVAYSALSLNIAGVTWLTARSSYSWTLILAILGASILLHFMMRFQLIQRWHCTQFYQVYRDSIVDLMTSKDDISTQIVRSSGSKGLNFLQKTASFIVWTRKQSLTSANYNYPTTLLLHDKIQLYNDIFFYKTKENGGRGNSIVEIIPTIVSLLCITLVCFHIGIKASSDNKISEDCVKGVIGDSNSTLRSISVCTSQ